MSNGEAAERAYVAAMVANADAQLADVTASVRADLDRLRETWAGGYDQQLAEAEQRMQAARDETRAFLRGMYDNDDEADDPAPSPDVAAQGQTVDASAGSSSPARPARPGPGQQPNPPATELAAEDIKNMPMSEYMQRRASLGVVAPESMQRLFG
jgi:hypothetical protein